MNPRRPNPHRKKAAAVRPKTIGKKGSGKKARPSSYLTEDDTRRGRARWVVDNTFRQSRPTRKATPRNAPPIELAPITPRPRRRPSEPPSSRRQLDLPFDGKPPSSRPSRAPAPPASSRPPRVVYQKPIVPRPGPKMPRLPNTGPRKIIARPRRRPRAPFVVERGYVWISEAVKNSVDLAQLDYDLQRFARGDFGLAGAHRNDGTVLRTAVLGFEHYQAHNRTAFASHSQDYPIIGIYRISNDSDRAYYIWNQAHTVTGDPRHPEGWRVVTFALFPGEEKWVVAP